MAVARRPRSVEAVAGPRQVVEQREIERAPVADLPAAAAGSWASPAALPPWAVARAAPPRTPSRGALQQPPGTEPLPPECLPLELAAANWAPFRPARQRPHCTAGSAESCRPDPTGRSACGQRDMR